MFIWLTNLFKESVIIKFHFARLSSSVLQMCYLFEFTDTVFGKPCKAPIDFSGNHTFLENKLGLHSASFFFFPVLFTKTMQNMLLRIGDWLFICTHCFQYLCSALHYECASVPKWISSLCSNNHLQIQWNDWRKSENRKNVNELSGEKNGIHKIIYIHLYNETDVTYLSALM